MVELRAMEAELAKLGEKETQVAFAKDLLALKHDYHSSLQFLAGVSKSAALKKVRHAAQLRNVMQTGLVNVINPFLSMYARVGALDKPAAFKGLWETFVKNVRKVHSKDQIEAGRHATVGNPHFLVFCDGCKMGQKISDDAFDHVMNSFLAVLQEAPLMSVGILLEPAAPNPASVAAQQSSRLHSRLERRAEVASLVMHCATLQMNVKALHC